MAIDPQIVRLGAIVGPPHLPQQHAVGKHPTGMASQRGEEGELLGRQIDLAVAHLHPVAGNVDLDVTGPGGRTAPFRLRADGEGPP